MKKIISCFVFIAILICIHSKVYSQKISANESVALNNYVEYMNFLSNELKNQTERIYRYYRKIKSFKNNPYNNSNTFYFNKLRPGKNDDNFYNKVINQSKNLNNADAQKLNSKITQLHDIYNQTVKLMQELEIYHKLDDYQTDNFKRCYEIINETQQKLFEFNNKYWLFYAVLEKTYYKNQPYNSNNVYQKCEKKMKDAMSYERNLFDDWFFNFEKDIQTDMFNPENLIKNINYIDNNYLNYRVPKSIKYPSDFYYKRFFGHLTGTIQETKRKGIDKYTIETKENDKHSNQYYGYLYKNYNSLLVWEYNQFVDAVSSTKMLKAPKMPYLFVIDSNKVEVATKYKKFTGSKYEPFSLIPQKKSITANQAMALNNYIIYINRETEIANRRAEKMRNYNKTINKYYNTDLSIFENRRPYRFKVYQDYRIARSLYEKSLNDSRYLPQKYAKSLNKQTEAINTICNERRHTVFQINRYADKKKFMDDNFTQAYALIKRFAFLWNEYDARKEHLYNDIKKIYDSYPSRDSDNPWAKTSISLEKIIYEDYKVLMDAKKHYTDSVNFSADVAPLNQAIRNSMLNKYENIKGLDEFGRYHGYCPYSIYDDIPTDSKDFLNNFLELKDKEKDTVITDNYYDDLARHYNDMIEDYNKLVWLAIGEYEEFSSHNADTFFLLRKPLQPDIFVLNLPENIPEPDNEEQHNIDTDDTLFTSMEGYAYNNLTLLLDVSGSMNHPSKLPLLKKSFFKLLTILRAQDYVSVVIYSGDAKIVLSSTSCSEKEIIKKTIQNLKSSGGTQINKGLKMAYQQAKDNYISNGNNRIILASDGIFKTNKKTEKIAKKIKKQNVNFTIFLFGKKNPESENLNKIIKNADGKIEVITPENMNLKLIKEVKKK